MGQREHLVLSAWCPLLRHSVQAEQVAGKPVSGRSLLRHAHARHGGLSHEHQWPRWVPEAARLLRPGGNAMGEYSGVPDYVPPVEMISLDSTSMTYTSPNGYSY